MNIKTRKVIEDLLSAVRLYRVPNTCAREIEAAEKLLKPPVRFAWAKISAGPGAGAYVADIGEAVYTVRRASGRPPSWRSVVTINGKDVKADYHATLNRAKQHCVDYGVARQSAKKA